MLCGPCKFILSNVKDNFFPTSRKKYYDFWCSLDFRSNRHGVLCALQLLPEWLERLTASSRVQRKTLQLVQAVAFPYGLLGPNEISDAQKITWSLWSEKVTMVQDSQKKPQGFRTNLCLLQPGPFFFWRRRTCLAPGALIETRWLWNISCSSCTECYLIYPAVKSSIFKWKQYIGECIWAGPESSSFIRWWLLTMPTHATCPFSTSQTCNIMNTSPVSANWKKKKTKM